MDVRKIRKFIYNLLYKLDVLFRSKAKRVVVLCYHSISNDKSLFSIDLQNFKKQIEILKKAGFEFITAKQLEGFLYENKDLPSKSVLITFDDGYSDMIDVKNFLVEEGIKPILFVLSDTRNLDRGMLGNSKKLLEENQILELAQAGWDIGSHGAKHRDLTTLAQNSLTEEVQDSKTRLEAITKTQIRYFSYPKGRYDKETLDLVKNSQYKLAFSMDDTLITGKTSKFAVPRIGIDQSHTLEEFITTFSPSVIIFRGFLKKILGSKLDKILNI
uniref:Polysaccharide deacetylase family protein n=1 Tax=candidate division WWE3 bacterium TaxID=2053526 RepID=A0A7C4TJ10_UNCKA